MSFFLPFSIAVLLLSTNRANAPHHVCGRLTPMVRMPNTNLANHQHPPSNTHHPILPTIITHHSTPIIQSCQPLSPTIQHLSPNPANHQHPPSNTYHPSPFFPFTNTRRSKTKLIGTTITITRIGDSHLLTPNHRKIWSNPISKR